MDGPLAAIHGDRGAFATTCHLVRGRPAGCPYPPPRPWADI